MRKADSRAVLGLFLTAILLLILNLFLEVPLTEGFNPSDDGVVLAQAFRLGLGQIPHLDFISIRPVGSALFHNLEFLLPMPLEVAARWLVLIQYLVYSFLWGLLFYRLFPPEKRKTLLLIGLAVLIFVLNQNHYNLFPWTTIDAVFFFSLGFFTYWNTKALSFGWLMYSLRVFLVILFVGFAALCRQSFAFPALILGLVLLFESIYKKRILGFSLGLVSGLLPYLIYLLILIKNKAWDNFLQQLTGRTELGSTGFVKFGQEFWASPFLILYSFLLVGMLAYRFWGSEAHSGRINKWVQAFAGILFFVVGLLITSVFWKADSLFSVSFVFFWLLVLVGLVSPHQQKGSGPIRQLTFWALLLAWTSAISLGDNAPVFTMGILAGALVVHLVLILGPVLENKRLWSSAAILCTLALITIGFWGQKKNNYRDLEAKRLHFSLRNEYPSMGGIRTNPNTYSYMKEIQELYQKLGAPEGRFVVLPNGGLIYPLLNTRNPFPLDWMQGPEFIGQESQLLTQLEQLNVEGGIYVLLDRYNSKRLAIGKEEMVFDPQTYPYYELIRRRSNPVPISSSWFEVRLFQ